MKAYATCVHGTKVLPFTVSSSYPRTTSVPGSINRASRGRRFVQVLHRVWCLVPLITSSDCTIFISLTSFISPHVPHLTSSGSSGACAHKQSFKKQMSSQFPRTTRPTQKNPPGPPQGPTRPKPGPARPKLGMSQIFGDLEIWELGIKKTINRNSQHPKSFCPKCRQSLDQ